MNKDKLFTVSTLNSLLKLEIESNSLFQGISLKGEISSFKAYPNGNIYLSIKDATSSINAVFWSSYSSRLKFVPKIGDEVIVYGGISVFQNKGTYQFNIFSMELAGKGDQLEALKALYEKLKAEGLFDEENKLPIPSFPRRIGVIAGENSAGMKDIVHNISLRNPLVELFVFPSLVQGVNAPKDLLRALEFAKKCSLDVLIIGRGGGSNEDLSAFNDETLVRALAASKLPIVSAVGHEIDTTLCDLVASKRVSTPTAAAVLVTIDQNELFSSFDEYSQRLNYLIGKHLSNLSEQLNSFKSRPCLSRYDHQLTVGKDALDSIKSNFLNVFSSYFNEKISSFNLYKEKLNTLSPYNVLNRGYSLLENEDGKIISSIEEINVGEEVKTHLHNGIIYSRVSKKESK
ncbi:MAG: exodeoxyribonuclease VII large subunit [Bacilli bacterium]|nr:exodeoxyribonuclease VII large subunit [Bacilli bacterium]MDY6430653.1 exodeoxyribonuclease VII large subunit [Bacilli bacterium]